MATPSLRFALVAGEVSGDMLAAPLIAALKQRSPDSRFFGIGGPLMQSQGMDCWWPAETLAVHGYSDALRQYLRLSRLRRNLLRRLLADPPDIFIGVDAPDFNFWLERRLKRAGVTVLHYVSPSIWAWRGGRIKKIGKAIHRVLALFPFEPPLYEKAGIPVTFVGHPLADSIAPTPLRETTRKRLELANHFGQIVALLPGSRMGELRMMTDLMIETASQLLELRSDLIFLVPLATRATRLFFESALRAENKKRAENERPPLPFRLLYGHGQDALAAADVALIASGTATLEALLVKTPHIITYRVTALTAFIMRRLSYLPWIGLPNILAGRNIVPEYVQKAAQPEHLARALEQLLTQPDEYDAQIQAFTEIHRSLQQDAANTAADAVLATQHALHREKPKQ